MKRPRVPKQPAYAFGHGPRPRFMSAANQKIASITARATASKGSRARKLGTIVRRGGGLIEIKGGR